LEDAAAEFELEDELEQLFEERSVRSRRESHSLSLWGRLVAIVGSCRVRSGSVRT